MKVFISGGSGFVGTRLSNNFLAQGHDVIGVGGSKKNRTLNHKNYTYVSADTTKAGKWQNYLKNADVVVNLAGQTIFHYWTKQYKKKIYDSRILTTRNIVSALPKDHSMLFLSASAVGIYGDCGDDLLPESHTEGDDFLATVCRDWEKEAKLGTSEMVSLAIMRFGVVLDAGSGAFPTMLLPYKLMVGGKIGAGSHWFPWIHIDDLIAAVNFIISERKDGVFNFCSPSSVRNRESSKIIGKVFHKPSIFTTPAFILRMILKEFGDLLLFSQKGYPENLLNSGFEFKYPDFKKALEEIKLRR
jgi:uncharacterized protein